MKKIVFIGGPTASGKTDLAVKIAKDFNGELINADSRQIYKFLDIGTNKGDIIEIEGKNFIDDIPIHLVSFLNPDERYSVFEFKIAALNLIEEITSKNKLPIIVGGTGLYIDSIIKNYELTSTTDSKIRENFESKSLEELTTFLTKNFNEEFTKLNSSDRLNKRRLVRLIEKLLTPPPQYQTSKLLNYDYIFLYPDYNWEDLTLKIGSRVEKMFKEGLVKEVEDVLLKGFSKSCVALQGTGYKEVIQYLEGDIDLKSCIELVKISHRQYARRQRTWFEGEGRGYNLLKVKDYSEAKDLVEAFL